MAKAKSSIAPIDSMMVWAMLATGVMASTARHELLLITPIITGLIFIAARQANRQLDGFDAGPPPDLSVVAFRYLPASGGVDEFNERLLRHIQDEGRVMLSGTRIDGSYRLRCAILCFRTHLEHVEDAIEAILDGVAALNG